MVTPHEVVLRMVLRHVQTERPHGPYYLLVKDGDPGYAGIAGKVVVEGACEVPIVKVAREDAHWQDGVCFLFEEPAEEEEC
jgi:hypothetical protein